MAGWCPEKAERMVIVRRILLIVTIFILAVTLLTATFISHAGLLPIGADAIGAGHNEAALMLSFGAGLLALAGLSRWMHHAG
jgi:hypothetical protein